MKIKLHELENLAKLGLIPEHLINGWATTHNKKNPIKEINDSARMDAVHACLLSLVLGAGGVIVKSIQPEAGIPWFVYFLLAQLALIIGVIKITNSECNRFARELVNLAKWSRFGHKLQNLKGINIKVLESGTMIPCLFQMPLHRLCEKADESLYWLAADLVEKEKGYGRTSREAEVARNEFKAMHQFLRQFDLGAEKQDKYFQPR